MILGIRKKKCQLTNILKFKVSENGTSELMKLLIHGKLRSHAHSRYDLLNVDVLGAEYFR